VSHRISEIQRLFGRAVRRKARGNAWPLSSLEQIYRPTPDRIELLSALHSAVRAAGEISASLLDTIDLINDLWAEVTHMMGDTSIWEMLEAIVDRKSIAGRREGHLFVSQRTQRRSDELREH